MNVLTLIFVYFVLIPIGTWLIATPIRAHYLRKASYLGYSHTQPDTLYVVNGRWVTGTMIDEEQTARRIADRLTS